MHAPAVLPADIRSPSDDFSITEREGEMAYSSQETHVPYFTLAELPGYSTIFDVSITGRELGDLFTQHPDWPGAILFDENNLVGVISQGHFYKCVSRAFGREIYHQRPARIMLEESTPSPLILSSECPIQTAVEHCLVRPFDLIYEPFLVHEEESGEYRLCAFQTLLLASSHLASLRNQQMEQILNSVTDGLLVIDRNFRIGNEYSKAVESIFERSDLGNTTLTEILHPLMDAVTYEQLQDYLKILFDPQLIDRLIKSVNPAKQITVHFPSSDSTQEKGAKHFAINFERIRTQKEISQVLVRIEDITQRINLARELEQQEAATAEKLQLIMQILQVEPEVLNQFITRFDEELSAMEEQLGSLDANADSLETVNNFFRRTHTLKGEASLIRLTIHERALHQLENHLEELRDSSQLEESEISSLQASLVVLQRLADQVHQALAQLKRLDAPAQSRATSSASRRDGLMETLARMIKTSGQSLGKSATFHASVREDDLPEKYREVLREVLIHLARNAIVHGIESTEERVAKGKSPSGLIQLELKPHPDCLEIIFQDDGGGLNYEKIRQRAGQLGRNLSSEEELREVIFEPGFSTSEKVMELAGRGVGLDAVRHALQQVGGRVLIHSQQGAYCAFQILLPMG